MHRDDDPQDKFDSFVDWNFDWHVILDGGIWTLIPGEDFHVPVAKFRRCLYYVARVHHETKVRTRYDKAANRLFVQAVRNNRTPYLNNDSAYDPDPEPVSPPEPVQRPPARPVMGSWTPTPPTWATDTVPEPLEPAEGP